MKTYTPDLDAAVLDRLRAYASGFAEDFPHARPAAWAGVYLQGLLLDGEHKSIEPLSRRVQLPDGLHVKDPDQALQQFVNQSPWDHQAALRRYRANLAPPFHSPQGLILFDDVSFPKQGKHSVGVQRQYCGALGTKANCQVAVTAHYVSPWGHYPLDLRLYLPDSWLTDKGRLDKAGVPQDQRRVLTKPRIALELLDRVRDEGLPAKAVVADAGYGSTEFRDGLQARGMPYVVGVGEELVVFPFEPSWDGPSPSGRGAGRPRSRPRLARGQSPPVSLGELARGLKLRAASWREGTKGKLSGRFAWLRVWPGSGWQEGACAGAEPLWLLIEEQAGGKIKYALSNLPVGTGLKEAVRVWKSRWPVDTCQAYYPSRRRWGGTRRIGYHRRDGVARTRRLVSATPGKLHRRSRMSDTTRRPVPPRA